MAHQGQNSRTSAGTDPAYVPDREVFDAYTHQQIWDQAHEELAPAELRRLADVWGLAASALESAFDDHSRDITRLSGEWSGIAAAAAARAATALIRAGDESVAVCRVLEQLMAANSGAAESVRAAIPPPPEPYLPEPDPAVEAATGAQRRTAYNTAAAAAAATAQDAMTFGYNPVIPASGDSVPRFPTTIAEVDGGEAAGVSGVAGPRAVPTAPETEPPQGPGISPGQGETAPAEPGTEPTARGTTPGTAPGLPGEHPHPLIDTDSTPQPVPLGEGSPPAGPSPDAPPGAGTPADEAGTPGTTPPDTSPDSGSPLPEDAAPADTTPAGTNPAPDTHPSGADPAARAASSSPIERGATLAGGPGTAEPQPRPSTGPTPVAIGGPAPAGAGPANPASPVPPTPASTPGAVVPGQSGPAGALPGQGPTTTGYRPGSAVTPLGTGVPGVSAPGSGAPTNTGTGPAGPPPPSPTPDSISRAPAGVAEQVTRQPAPGPTGAGYREPLRPAGTESDTSPSPANTEHSGTRPLRLVPAGIPLAPHTGSPPARAADHERPSPDYLHAPNEDLTATQPAIPPVLGEYTEAEQAERADPGGGSH
ncbi:hypothetical protein [Nocardia sp. NPDC019395]|uniref:hypothetical protein n=1 Tax=Nocardia sp. NPDC019395 TaxID=3154686 RepID=UPI0033F72D04